MRHARRPAADEIAQRVGATPPDNIVVGLTEGFYVTDQDIVLEGGEGVITGRTLHFPVTLMPFLNTGEFFAVVGHEFGHFAGGDLEFSARFIPVFRRTMNAILPSAQDGRHYQTIKAWVRRPVLSLAILFFNSFDEVITHWRHVREFAADQIGGQAAGVRSRASALIRSSLSYPVIFSVLDKVWHNPDRERGSLLEEMAEAARQKGFDDPAEHLEESQQHPTDTHPTTRERVEALGLSCDDADLLADASRPPDESSVETYLPQADAICARLAEGFRREASEYQAALDVCLAEKIALARDEPFVLYGTQGASCLAALSLFVAVIAAGFGILMFALQAGDDFVAAGFVSLGIALLFGVPALLWERRKKRGPMPILVFTDTGLASRAFTGELP